jgi:hypothetical protein
LRSVATFVLLGLGAFAIATGLVLRLYTYPELTKIPHDIDTVSVSQGSGITALVYVPHGTSTLPEIRHNLSLTATTHTKGDLSQPEIKKDGNVTVWTRSTIVKDDKDGLTLSADVRRTCLDRHTGESVIPCQGQFYETEQGKRVSAERNELLQPGLSVQFPFDTGRRAYPWYDTVLKKAVDINFDGEESVQGLAVYRFFQTVPPTKLGEFSVPGDMVGRPGEADVKVTQYYEVGRTLWVEPITGTIIGAREDVRQELRAPGQAAGSGTAVFDGELQLNEASVSSNVAIVKANLPMLFAITTLPVILLISGGVVLLLGALLLIFGRVRFLPMFFRESSTRAIPA